MDNLPNSKDIYVADTLNQLSDVFDKKMDLNEKQINKHKELSSVFLSKSKRTIQQMTVNLELGNRVLELTEIAKEQEYVLWKKSIEQRINNLSIYNSDILENVSIIKKENESLKKTLFDIEAEKSNQKKREEDIFEDINKKRREVLSKIKELNKAKDDLYQLKTQSEQENSLLKDRIKELEVNITKKEKKKNESKVHYQYLEDKCNQNQQELEKQERINKDLQRIINNLQKENESYENNIRDNNEYLVELNHENDKLKDRIHNIENQLNEYKDNGRREAIKQILKEIAIIIVEKYKKDDSIIVNNYIESREDLSELKIKMNLLAQEIDSTVQELKNNKKDITEKDFAIGIFQLASYIVKKEYYEDIVLHHIENEAIPIEGHIPVYPINKDINQLL